jgi:predicted nuclease of restriction endonuclease-like RecB superfamily
LQLILRKRKFSDGKFKFSPIFLIPQQELLDTIAELINRYEINLGTRNTDFYDDDYFIDKFSDIRILKGINFLLTKYYYTYNIIGPKSGFASVDLRLKLYNHYNDSSISFVLPKNKDSFFQQFSDSNNLNIEDVKKNLFSDHALFKVLNRKDSENSLNTSPLPKEVVLSYNKEIIKTLLNRSYWFEFSFNSDLIDGTKFKNLLFLTKRLGLYYESTRISHDKVKLRILGPQELVGRSSKYGRNLNILLLKNLNFFINNKLVVDLLMNHFGQKREVSIEFSLVNDLLEITDKELTEFDEEFDSKIEERFNNLFSALDKKWEITREPVIIEDGIIMIPDFKLKYNEIIIYVEIVGFWTEKYLNHKIRKVRLLENKYKDMILFIDENLNFPSTKLKTFRYGKEIHVSDLIHYMEEKYELPYIRESIEKIKIKKTELITAVNELLSKNYILTFEKVISFIPEFKNVETLLELINEEFFLNNENKNFIIASNSQLVLNLTFLDLLKQKIIKLAKEKTIWIIEDLFGEVSLENVRLKDKELKIALKILGCTWKIRNLVEEHVLLPTAEKNIHELPSQLKI